MFHIEEFLRQFEGELKNFNQWLPYVTVDFVREFSHMFEWDKIDVKKFHGDRKVLKEFKKELGL